jgi:hypothetical protein
MWQIRMVVKSVNCSETIEVTKLLSYATTLVNTNIMHVRRKFYRHVLVNYFNVAHIVV